MVLLALLAAAGCTNGDPVVLEPEEIDVCPEIAQQLETHLRDVVAFVEAATPDDLESPQATELAERGRALSQRAVDLDCSAAEVKALIDPGGLVSDDPIAQQFIDLVVDALG